jgi:hypothetical protein
MSTPWLALYAWPGTWQPSTDGTSNPLPVVLDIDLQGTLQSIPGPLTAIAGAKITEGMIAYLQTGYGTRTPVLCV